MTQDHGHNSEVLYFTFGKIEANRKVHISELLKGFFVVIFQETGNRVMLIGKFQGLNVHYGRY